MAQSKLNTKQIQVNGFFRIENVSKVALTNYSNQTISFVIDGVKRFLPMAQTLPDMPTAEVEFSDFGRTFDFECDFDLGEIGGEAINKVIIDYFQPKMC